MITQKKQAGKLRQVLLGSLILLNIFCLPSFSINSQLQSQQVIQTELPLMNRVQTARALVYENAFFTGRNPHQREFEGPSYTKVLQYYHELIETRFKDLAVQRRHFNKSAVTLFARINSQYPDEELILS